MRMGEKIIHRRLNIMGYDHIIYHLGTNDIVTYDMQEIQDSILELNHITRLFNKKANIILGLPLPTTRDLQQTWPKQEVLNHCFFPNQQHNSLEDIQTIPSKKRLGGRTSTDKICRIIQKRWHPSK